MKTLKCPLCGEELAPSVKRYGFEYACWKCKWQTSSLCASEQGAKEAAQKLISKFPPIMRLNQGDNVLIWLSDDIYTVLGTDLEAGKYISKTCMGMQIVTILPTSKNGRGNSSRKEEAMIFDIAQLIVF